jgi:uncharacterized membrane protein YeiB
VVRFSFYPASVALLLGVAAVGVLLVLLADWAETNGRLSAIKGLRYLGQTSLTLLFFHIVVFREGFQRWGLWRGFDALETLSAIGSLLLLWAVFSEYWARANYAFGLEWVLRRVSGRERATD